MEKETLNTKSIPTLSSTLKFQVFILFCLLVHALIATFAFYNHITPLGYFNIGSLLVYFLCILLLKQRQVIIFYVGFIEIILHSFTCVILIGVGFGFTMYFIALVPMAYNLLHAIKSKHYVIKSSLMALLSFVMYAGCYMISTKYQPIYNTPSLDAARPYVYLINMLIAFVALTFFSVLFLMETESAYNSLYNKNQELSTLANTDPLTGLYNRRTMAERVKKLYGDSQKSQHPFSLILCDLDDFKLINDTYGHDCGDEVLRTISKVLGTLTKEQEFLCRWGGEEFLILLNNIDATVARTIAEQIRIRVAETKITYQEYNIAVTMTIGVASSEEAESYNSLFKMADDRMYKGKTSGKNVVV